MFLRRPYPAFSPGGRLIITSALSLLGTLAFGQDLPDIVLADFEGATYGSWRTEGNAFGTGPSHAEPANDKIDGFQGRGFASSHHNGDRATGVLVSPEFVIERHFLTFFIGGGGWPEKTCLNLLIDGKVVRTAAGDHVVAGGSEHLRPVVWDLTEYQGRHGRIEVVDRATGRWGHITVDNIVLTQTPPTFTTDGGGTRGDKSGEVLYNGIRLPTPWPPVLSATPDRNPVEPPYLTNPPAVILIDVGRQLFVDDFLIEKTDLVRSFHHASKYLGNPILAPVTELERNRGQRPCAAPFDDGVWYDPKDAEFKMWYHAGWFDGTALATSKDGLVWRRPELDVVPGTNRILPAEGHGHRDGAAVWLDYAAADPRNRYKMFVFEWPPEQFGGRVMTSPDGIHWGAPKQTSAVGSNTTIHYNPFRRKWVYSVRTTRNGARARGYRECDDLLAGATWKKEELVHWACADALDLPDPAFGEQPQLYDLDAAPYESIMLGLFNILKGPASNEALREAKVPATTEIEIGFSRDGFYWHRPDREPFIPATRKEGDWDRAYLHPTASVCNVIDDRLYFYYGAWSGESPALGADMYAGGATGVALLRRDGFASMDGGDAPGFLTTRPLAFHGKYLFVNLDSPLGELRVEILDEAGQSIPPFTLDRCRPLEGDSAKQRVQWRDADNLASLAMRKVRFRFQLQRGKLYSFWVSPHPTGASYGYVAAGGPGFSGPIDAEENPGDKP